MALFPHKIIRTDVYAEVDYGRGYDLARASGQPAKDPVGVRLGWVQIEDTGHDYVKEPDGKIYVVMMLEYGGPFAIERYATKEEAMAAHDRMVLELKTLSYVRASSVTK